MSHSARWRANAAAIAIATGSALGYLGLATPRLAVQGLHYDELHQAPAAFAFVPGSRNWSAAYSLIGVPVLSMPYSGALKSVMYGGWLRLSGRPFTVKSWRALGCLLAAAGILLVCASFARWISAPGALVLGMLLATDITVLLATRHDWGPVALGLALRLALLAVWLRAWSRESANARDDFALGMLLGLAVYEKLSSVVLVVPLGAAFLLDRRRRGFRHLAWAVAGGMAGSALLLMVNVHSWVTTRSLVSLSSDALKREPFPPLSDFFVRYYELGAGAVLREWMLGDETPAWRIETEGALLALLGLTVILAALWARPAGRFMRAAAVFALLHPLVGLAVLALPAGTWVHHWVIGTPFQYVACGLAVAALATGEVRGAPAGRLLAWGFAPLLALFLILRGSSVLSLEHSLRAGHASRVWDPSFTRLAEFANRQPSATMFVAAEWGLANQILCVSDGRRAVPEPYWGYRDRQDLDRLVEGVPRFYLVARKPAGEVPGRADRILADARTLHAFREEAVEGEIASLDAVQAWKFVRATGATR